MFWAVVRRGAPRSGTGRTPAACRTWSAHAFRLELLVLPLEALGVALIALLAAVDRRHDPVRKPVAG